MTGFPTLKIIENNTAVFTITNENAFKKLASGFESDGIRTRTRITAKSWNNKIPIDSLPCLVLRSNRSINIFETIAVEDIVMAEPIMKPSDSDNPNNDPMIIVNNNVITT